ncbi:hypothetical protein RvY_13879 [Ramazzottius varieornatus]|uniref:Coiled-coil domain-containing protein 86 n=1 Tax=Ramazzottius varieornatus TaxID=947166 RepID=A0A1D1VXY2_RAMVA|nr:hypothetical protein RvY_13879 [Ramazzottius varieornatus]
MADVEGMEEAPAAVESDVESEVETTESQEAAKAPKGRPKSGRIWKVNHQRFSSVVKVQPLRTTWATKMKAKTERKLTKAHEKEMSEEKKKEKEDARKRIEERKKRQEENTRRAEIVQPIKNTAKIKRMKRKQLRSIEKR